MSKDEVDLLGMGIGNKYEKQYIYIYYIKKSKD